MFSFIQSYRPSVPLKVSGVGIVRKNKASVEEQLVMHSRTEYKLALGINLTAHAVVIIIGTRFYDSEKGKFSDLNILDILQIFGRVVRHQFVYYYLGLLTYRE